MALAVFLITAGPANAAGDDPLNLVPSFTAQETYDSNVNFDGRGDMEHRLAPSLSLELNQERVRGHLRATGTEYKYTRLSSYDRFDQSYDGQLEMNATERLVANIAASSKLDHTFSSSVAETGQLAQKVTRRVTSLAPSVTYNVTELTTATLFGGFSQTRYGDKIYTDSDTNNMGLSLSYMLNERTAAIMQAVDTRTTLKTGKQDVLSWMGGAEYSVTETIKARLLAGISSLHSQTDASGDYSKKGFSADSSVQWTGETGKATLGLARDLSSGLSGENIVRTRVSLGMYKHLTERFQLLVSANLVESKTTGNNVTPQTTRWMEAVPSLRYLTSEDSTVSLGYGQALQQTVETGVSKRRSQMFLNFTIAFP